MIKFTYALLCFEGMHSSISLMVFSYIQVEDFIPTILKTWVAFTPWATCGITKKMDGLLEVGKGVGFKSGTHRVVLETLTMVPSTAMSGT